MSVKNPRFDGKKTGRTNDGRFAPGNAGGPGRPRRATEEAYLLATLNACPLEAWEEIVTAAVEAAKAGDWKAREWLAGYLLGEAKAPSPTPTAALVSDELGGDEVARQARKKRDENVLNDALSFNF